MSDEKDQEPEDEVTRALEEEAQAEVAAEAPAPVMSEEERQFRGRVAGAVRALREGKAAFAVVAREPAGLWLVIRPDLLAGISVDDGATGPSAFAMQMNAAMVGGLVRGLVQGLREGDPQGAHYQFGPAPGEEPRIVVPGGIPFPRRRDS